MKTKIEYIRRVLGNLPVGNRIILDTLISFLREVSEHKSNCMGVRNLSIVFAPNLIRPKVENIEEILANSSAVNTLMMLLIQYYGNIFLNKEFEELEAPQEAVLSPHLISLKKARSIHKNESLSYSGSDGVDESVLSSSVPQSVRNRSKSVMKKTRSKETMSSSLDDETLMKVRRKESRRNVPQSITAKQKVKKKEKADDTEFLDTLRKGTLKLASSLIEEKELEIEAACLDEMPEEGRKHVEIKLKNKIVESKQLKKKARKARRLRRIQSTDHSRSRSISKAKSDVKNPHSSGLSRTKSTFDRVEKDDKKLRTSSSDNKISRKYKHNKDPSTSSVDSDVKSTTSLTSVTSSDDPLYIEDPKFDEELDEILSSDEDDEILNTIKDDDIVKSTSELSLKDEGKEDSDLEGSLDDLISAVLSGNVDTLNEFLGKMPKMKQMERKKSKKKIVSRLKRRQRTQSMI